MSTMVIKGSGRGFTLIETIIFILVLSIGAAGIMTLYQNVLSRGADPLLRHKGLVLAQDLMDEILSKRWDEHTPNGGGCLDSCDMEGSDGKDHRNNDSECGDNGVRVDDYHGDGLDDNCNCDGSDCDECLASIDTACDFDGDGDCDADDASAIGFDVGESDTDPRRNWNDVDDYDGLDENNQNEDPDDDLKDPQRNVMSEVGSYRRKVDVTYVKIDDGVGTEEDPYSFAMAGNNGKGDDDPDDGNCSTSSSPRTNFKQVVVTVTTPNNEEIKLVSIKGNF
ncbi:MAG: hypothetical protein U9P37_08120 [Pseudomonadota bacterium]|nr:hypothetical protein [Pseudomonadota bacterium]